VAAAAAAATTIMIITKIKLQMLKIIIHYIITEFIFYIGIHYFKLEKQFYINKLSNNSEFICYYADENVDENACVCATHSEVSLSGGSSTRQSFSKEKKIDRSDEVLNLVATKLLQSSEGKFSAYGKHVARKLESLPKKWLCFAEELLTK
jgi:hypothetical protein